MKGIIILSTGAFNTAVTRHFKLSVVGFVARMWISKMKEVEKLFLLILILILSLLIIPSGQSHFGDMNNKYTLPITLLLETLKN